MKAEQVEALRARMGLSQTEFADLLQTTKRTVNRWEKRGASGPTSVALEALEAGWRPGDGHWQEQRDECLDFLANIEDLVARTRERVTRITVDEYGKRGE